MARYFFDTSALVKRYHAEAGAQAVEAMFAEPRAAFVVSRLAIVECVSAFGVKVRSGELDASELPVLRKSLLGDVKQQVLQVSRILVRQFSLAEELLVRHAPIQRLRASDAIHVAVALDLLQNQQIDVFVVVGHRSMHDREGGRFAGDQSSCSGSLDQSGSLIVKPLVHFARGTRPVRGRALIEEHSCGAGRKNKSGAREKYERRAGGS